MFHFGIYRHSQHISHIGKTTFHFCRSFRSCIASAPAQKQQTSTIFLTQAYSSRVHSGIRVHLTLRGCNSLYIYPIGTKCTSNAFFLHAEDGKNIFVSLLHCDGGKLETPPPPLRQLNDSGLRVSGGLSLLWCVIAVRSQTRSPRRCRFV